MSRSVVFMGCVSLLCLGASSRVQADEVQSFGVVLTGGFLVFDPTDTPSPGQISVEGTAFSMEGTSRTGFELQGLGDPYQSFVEPLLGCLVCAPGDRIGTNVIISDWILGGVTLDGQGYTFGPEASAIINIGGGLITVPAFRPSVVVATTTFGVQDSGFAAHADGQSGPFASIQGAGRVSLTFAPASAGGLWDLRDIRYDFGPTPTPTPEPATLTLVSGALVAAAIRARKRRDSRNIIQLSTSTSTA